MTKGSPRPLTDVGNIITLVMEQPRSGKGHDHVLFITLFDNQIIPDGAAGFCDVLDTGSEGALDVVAEGEERITA